MIYEISKSLRYRIYKDFAVACDLCTGRFFLFQDTSLDIFCMIINIKSIDVIVSKLHCLYEVCEDDLRKDVQAFLESLCADGVLYSEFKDTVKQGQNYPQWKEKIEGQIDNQHIYNLMATNRILFSAAFEVTEQCNENCVHCYRPLPSSNVWQKHTYSRVLSELQNAGCLLLDFTGGEPFLHPYFQDILVDAANKGFVLSILSNGTCIGEDTIEMLADLPLLQMHISLYATNSEIHDSITRMPGSWKKTIDVIGKLKTKGIPVALSCIIMEKNEDEVELLAQYAQKHDIGCDYSKPKSVVTFHTSLISQSQNNGNQ